MIKDCEKKIIDFNKLITQKFEASITYEFTAQTFKLTDIDCFTSYLIQKFFINYSEDFQYSIEIILKEGILNAFYHGNFNMDSKIKETENGFEIFNNLFLEKQKDEKYNSKKVALKIVITKNKIFIKIKDEGDGFRYSDLKFNNYKPYGRGIKLIIINSNKVYWNQTGNQIIIEKNTDG